jgi:histidyl-tRNA synthetase
MTVLRDDKPRELYPKKAKMDKQFKYADKKGVLANPIGSKEVENKTRMVKDLKKGVTE